MADQSETEPLRSYRSILDHCLIPYLRVMRYRDSLVGTMMSGIEAVRDHELDKLREERDQAIAHDRQPYPTQWAYDQACAALETHRTRADTAEAINARVLELHSGPRTERHGSGCVQCGLLWPCPTRRALDGHDRPGMVTVRRADLDLVMNHAGDPATVAEYPAAHQRIQDAIGGRRG